MDDWVLGRPTQLWPTFTNAQGKECPYLLRVFESKTTCVVLARSNDPSREVNQDYCAESNIPVLRRRGGGGTVVLGPGCQIVTFAFFARSLFDNSRYFSIINDCWIAALERAAGIQAGSIHQRGISDLAVGNKKIAGTSLFRRKHLVVFQGSLLVDPDFETIERCLCHPSREPDYRMGRSHLDFLTSLERETLWSENDMTTFSKNTQMHLQAELGSKLRDDAMPAWSE